MATKVLIFGAGSIGGAYAVILSRAVPAVDITVICRSNFDAVSKNGFTLHSNIFGRDLNAKPSVARNVDEAVKANKGAPFDYIFITTKALPTTPAWDLIKPAVTRETTIVLIQNGIDTEAPFAALFPDTPLLSTVVYLPTTQTEPGVIEHRELELLHIGTYPAAAPAAHKAAASALADLLTRAGASSKLHDDVQTERWSKLLVNASWNSICALTRCRDRTLLDVRTEAAGGEFADFVRGVMLEIAATARAYGYAAIDAELVDFQLGRAIARDLPGVQPSMMADALAGRNMEVEAIVGNTVKLAREKGVPTPALQTIYFLLAGLDRSFTLARS